MSSSQKQPAQPFNLPGDIFEYGRTLGSGSYGTVQSFRIHGEGGIRKNAAVKRISNVFDDFLITRRTLREIKLMRHFNHNNIIKIVDTFFQEAEKPDDEKIERNRKIGYHYEKLDLYLLSELCDYDLDQIIRSRKQIDPKAIRSYTLQILLGLKFLHKGHVVHRDLKPANIFVKRDGQLKLGDLGLARAVNLDDEGDCVYPDGENLTEYVVTRWYRAPEILILRGCYSPIIDIWSVGCIVWEMFSRQCLLPGKGGYDQVQRILQVVGCHPDCTWLDNTIERQESGLSRREKPTRIDDVAANHAKEVMRKISDDTLQKFPGVYNHLDQSTYPLLQSSRYSFPGRNNFATCNLPDTGKHGQRLPSIYRDLIEKMLQFNPEVRMSVDESLKHPLFQECRPMIQEQEEDLITVEPINMAYDMAYDPKASDSKNIPLDYRTDLRDRLLEEMSNWKREKVIRDKRELQRHRERQAQQAAQQAEQAAAQAQAQQQTQQQGQQSEIQSISQAKQQVLDRQQLAQQQAQQILDRQEQVERAQQHQAAQIERGNLLWSREGKRQRGDEQSDFEMGHSTSSSSSSNHHHLNVNGGEHGYGVKHPSHQNLQHNNFVGGRSRGTSKRSADNAGAGGHVHNSQRPRDFQHNLTNIPSTSNLIANNIGNIRAPQLLPFPKGTTGHSGVQQHPNKHSINGGQQHSNAHQNHQLPYPPQTEDLYARNLQNMQRIRYESTRR